MLVASVRAISIVAMVAIVVAIAIAIAMFAMKVPRYARWVRGVGTVRVDSAPGCLVSLLVLLLVRALTTLVRYVAATEALTCAHVFLHLCRREVRYYW